MEKIYGNRSCSLYEISSDGFDAGKTGWDAELVSEKPAPVLKEICIYDIYAYLKDAAENGKCIIHRYSEERTYQEWLRDELGERIKDFGLSEEDVKKDSRLNTIFK